MACRGERRSPMAIASRCPQGTRAAARGTPPPPDAPFRRIPCPPYKKIHFKLQSANFKLKNCPTQPPQKSRFFGLFKASELQDRVGMTAMFGFLTNPGPRTPNPVFFPLTQPPFYVIIIGYAKFSKAKFPPGRRSHENNRYAQRHGHQALAGNAPGHLPGPGGGRRLR